MDSGSGEPSPGNQEITFPSLRAHVAACCLCVCVFVQCVSVRLLQAVFEDDVLF